MMLSLLTLNKTDKNLKYAANPYLLHQFVHDLFHQYENKKRSFLYADKGGNDLEKKILILSEDPPQPKGSCRLDIKEIPKSFLSQRFYNFEIKVNPVKRSFKKQGCGPLVPLKTNEEVEHWFKFKALKHGFQIEQLEILSLGVEIFQKHLDQKSNPPITQGFAHLQGVLEVKDQTLFKQTVQNGFGRGKSFGLGLLQVVPILQKK
jgi:CRISPR system Cascade subunit CasE